MLARQRYRLDVTDSEPQIHRHQQKSGIIVPLFFELNLPR